MESIINLFLYSYIFINLSLMVYVIIGISLDTTFFPQCLRLCYLMRFLVGLMHYSWDPQIFFLAKTTLKLGPTILFTHLKIILLQCFQFSVFSNKWYPNRP